eukprot:Gb_37883 [translate_table: standard]
MNSKGDEDIQSILQSISNNLAELKTWSKTFRGEEEGTKDPEELKELYKEEEPWNMCLNTPKLSFVGPISEEYIVEENEMENAHNNEDDDWLFEYQQEKVEYEDYECKNTNDEFRVDKCEAEKNDEKTQGKDTQEEITKNQTYKPMADEQEGDTLDKALAMQGKVYEDEQEEEDEDYNRCYHCLDDQEDARFYEILTPEEPQLASTNMSTTRAPSKSTDTLPNECAYDPVQFPIKKKVEGEEPKYLENQENEDLIIESLQQEIKDEIDGSSIESFSSIAFDGKRNEAQCLAKIDEKLGHQANAFRDTSIHILNKATKQSELEFKSQYLFLLATIEDYLAEQKGTHEYQEKIEKDEDLYGEAEILYLYKERMDLAISMERRLGDWFTVEILVQSIAQTKASMENLWNHISNILAERKDWRRASKYFMNAKNEEKLVECLYALEDEKELGEAMNEILDDYKLLTSTRENSKNWHMRKYSDFLHQGKAKKTLELSKPVASWGTSGPDSSGISKWKEVYGKVNKRILLGGGPRLAIKRAQQRSMQGRVEFKNEIKLPSRVHHKNLVEQMLVYEHMSNSNMRDSLSSRTSIHLDWRRMVQIALNSAKGLSYLDALAIKHRHIKSSSILMEENLATKEINKTFVKRHYLLHTIAFFSNGSPREVAPCSNRAKE